jgi:hypothetical protein
MQSFFKKNIIMKITIKEIKITELGRFITNKVQNESTGGALPNYFYILQDLINRDSFVSVLEYERLFPKNYSDVLGDMIKKQYIIYV